MTTQTHRTINTLGWFLTSILVVSLYINQSHWNTKTETMLEQCEVLLYEDLTGKQYSFSKA